METAVFGLCSTFSIKLYKVWGQSEFQSSPSVNTNRVTEINRRVVYEMWCLGQGLCSIELFYGLMGLPPPIMQTTHT